MLCGCAESIRLLCLGRRLARLNSHILYIISAAQIGGAPRARVARLAWCLCSSSVLLCVFLLVSRLSPLPFARPLRPASLLALCRPVLLPRVPPPLLAAARVLCVLSCFLLRVVPPAGPCLSLFPSPFRPLARFFFCARGPRMCGICGIALGGKKPSKNHVCLCVFWRLRSVD